MVFNVQLATLSWAIPAFSVILVSVSFVKSRYKQWVRSVPGPFIATFTDLWRCFSVYQGRFDLTLRALHEKHGLLVRIGPNCISVGDPAEIRTIYSITRLFPKVRITDMPMGKNFVP